MRTKVQPLGVLLGLILAAPGGEAFAHAQLVRAEPKVGAVITASPGRVWLRFNEVVRPPASGVQLVRPGLPPLLLQPLTADPKDPRAISAPLPADLGPGRYQVRWRALSPDGHRTQGDYVFTVRP